MATPPKTRTYQEVKSDERGNLQLEHRGSIAAEQIADELHYLNEQVVAIRIALQQIARAKSR